MPRVQTYGALTTSGVAGPATRHDLPGQTFNPAGDIAGAFGAVSPGSPTSVGNAISKLGGATSALGNRIGTVQAEDALLSFERYKNDLFFNPDSGYFNTEGRTAYDTAGETREKLNELRREYTKNLKSPMAQRAFGKSADAQITRAGQDINRHASSQFKAWEKANINSQIENTLENAALYWADEERLGVQKVLGRQSVIDGAILSGDSAEVKNEKLETYDSTFAQAAIESALQTGSDAAELTMEKYGDLLEGPARTNVLAKIDQKKQTEKVRDDANLATNTGAALVQDRKSVV